MVGVTRRLPASQIPPILLHQRRIPWVTAQRRPLALVLQLIDHKASRPGPDGQAECPSTWPTGRGGDLFRSGGVPFTASDPNVKLVQISGARPCPLTPSDQPLGSSGGSRQGPACKKRGANAERRSARRTWFPIIAGDS